MKEIQIYLMGGMSKFGKANFNQGNAWRVYTKSYLEEFNYEYKVKVINPNDYFNFKEDVPRYDSQREIMELDLHKLKTSQLAIINFNDMYSLGSMAELAIAYEKRIPVIGLDTAMQALHPWQIEMCSRIFSDVDEMLEYVKEFYLS